MPVVISYFNQSTYIQPKTLTKHITTEFFFLGFFEIFMVFPEKVDKSSTPIFAKEDRFLGSM